MKQLPARIQTIKDLSAAGKKIVVDGIKISPATAAVIVRACEHFGEDKRAAFENEPIKDICEMAWAAFHKARSAQPALTAKIAAEIVAHKVKTA
jgi:hypothetical protein